MIRFANQDLVVWQVVAVIAQIVLLGTIIMTSNAGGRTVVRRMLNPGCWLTFFYTLWFLIPQCVSITNANFILGINKPTAAMVLTTQGHLVAFLSVVCLGLLLIRWTIDFPAARLPPTLEFVPLRSREKWLLGIFYLVGFVATLYLGNELMSIDGSRAQLVKTPVGLAATTASFYGLFAMAVGTGHTLFHRRFLAAAAVIAVMGWAIFYTGARGRLLWPIVLGVAYVFCRTDRVRMRPLVGLGVLGFLVLLVFDPVLNSMRNNDGNLDMDQVQKKTQLSNLFMKKRNFDGFANFAVITNDDAPPRDSGVYLEGGRRLFMTNYFPEVWAKKVGFGTTLPGMLYLGGGSRGLLWGGFLYGIFLGVLGFIFRRIRSEPLFWAYAFAMTWLAAVGGNFQESLDKMATVASPGIVWLLLCPPRRFPIALRFPMTNGQSRASAEPTEKRPRTVGGFAGSDALV